MAALGSIPGSMYGPGKGVRSRCEGQESVLGIQTGTPLIFAAPPTAYCLVLGSSWTGVHTMGLSLGDQQAVDWQQLGRQDCLSWVHPSGKAAAAGSPTLRPPRTAQHLRLRVAVLRDLFVVPVSQREALSGPRRHAEEASRP